MKYLKNIYVIKSCKKLERFNDKSPHQNIHVPLQININLSLKKVIYKRLAITQRCKILE